MGGEEAKSKKSGEKRSGETQRHKDVGKEGETNRGMDEGNDREESEEGGDSKKKER